MLNKDSNFPSSEKIKNWQRNLEKTFPELFLPNNDLSVPSGLVDLAASIQAGTVVNRALSPSRRRAEKKYLLLTWLPDYVANPIVYYSLLAHLAAVGFKVISMSKQENTIVVNDQKMELGRYEINPSLDNKTNKALALTTLLAKPIDNVQSLDAELVLRLYEFFNLPYRGELYLLDPEYLARERQFNTLESARELLQQPDTNYQQKLLIRAKHLPLALAYFQSDASEAEKENLIHLLPYYHETDEYERWVLNVVSNPELGLSEATLSWLLASIGRDQSTEYHAAFSKQCAENKTVKIRGEFSHFYSGEYAKCEYMDQQIVDFCSALKNQPPSYTKYVFLKSQQYMRQTNTFESKLNKAFNKAVLHSNTPSTILAILEAGLISGIDLSDVLSLDQALNLSGIEYGLNRFEILVRYYIFDNSILYHTLASVSTVHNRYDLLRLALESKQVLLSKSYDLSCNLDQDFGVASAAMGGDIKALKLFVQYGFLFNYEVDSCIDNPLYQAIINKKYEVVPYLIDHGSCTDNFDSEGNSLLHYFIDDEEGFDFVLSLDVDVNRKNNNGDTALHTLLKQKRLLTGRAKKLIDKGANLAIVNNQGKTPFDYLNPETSNDPPQGLYVSTKFSDYVDLNRSKKKSTYIMARAAVVINKLALDANNIETSSLRLRTQLGYYKKSTDSQFVFQDIVNDLARDGEKRDQVLVDANAYQDNNDDVYIRFDQTVQAHQWVMLRDVHVDDELLGFCESLPPDSELVRFDTGYAVRLTQPCNISYVIQHDANKQHLTSLANFSIDDKQKAIIKKYQLKADMKCSHRCIGACRDLISSGVDASHLRVIIVDNNHVRLQWCIHSKWFDIDLGATASELIYDATAKEVSLPTATDRDESESWDDEHKGVESSGEVPTVPSHPGPQPQRLSQEANKPIVDPRRSQLRDWHRMLEATNTAKSIDRLAFKKVVDVNSLVCCNDAHVTAVEIIAQQTHLGADCYYLDHPNDLALFENSCANICDDHRVSRRINQLRAFLQNEHHPKVLVINWAKLPGCQGAYNSLLDDPMTLNGKRYPGVHVVSVVDKLPEDASFLRRHTDVFKLNHQHDLNSGSEVTCDDVHKIDMRGLLNWQERLFGALKISGSGGCYWNAADGYFSDQTYLQAGHYHLENLPKVIYSQVQRFLQLAQAQGYIDYHGRRITLDADTRFSIAPAEFDLAVVFDQEHHHLFAISGQPSSDVTLVNTSNFDALFLKRSVTEEGGYNEMPGILMHDAPLRLFITSPLSDAQWYALLSHRANKTVTLYMHDSLLEKLPYFLRMQMTKNAGLLNDVTDFVGEGYDEVKGDDEDRGAIETSELSQSNIHVIVTNDARQYCDQVRFNPETSLTLDVEDYAFEQLFYSIHPVLNSGDDAEGVSVSAQVAKTQLIDFLADPRKTLVLRGQFTASLLAKLEPLLHQGYIDINNHRYPIRANLSLVIEADNPYEQQAFSWLNDARHSMHVYYHHEIYWRYHEQEQQPSSTLSLEQLSEPEQLKAAADAFVAKRLDILKSCLAGCAIASITGPTGVGKTQIMHELEAQSGYRVFHELEHFDDWATDDSDDMKVLFIDEANIHNQHLTFLAPLTQYGPTRLLYNGKIVTLTDKHRVVFASNDLNYGGGRFQQQLLSRYKNAIAKIDYQCFSAEYIYDRLVAPLLESVADPGAIHEQIVNSIQGYQQGSIANVRELQQVIFELTLPESEAPREQRRSLGGYVLTTSMRPVVNAITRFIRTQQCKKSRDFSQGINALYIEGCPSAGKSAAIAAVLEDMGLVKDTDYVVISAGASIATIRERLSDAYAQGKLVWFDEFNTRIDDGVLKMLNPMLTGQYPGGRAGFGVISSCNGAHLRGRHQLGPDFQARCRQVKAPKPDASDVAMIIQQKYFAVVESVFATDTEAAIDEMAVLFCRAWQYNPALALDKLEPLLLKWERSLRFEPERPKLNGSCLFHAHSRRQASEYRKWAQLIEQDGIGMILPDSSVCGP